MNIIKIIILIVTVGFGIFMIVFGERDDSPGAQMLGLLLAIFGIMKLLKFKKKKSGESQS